MIFPSATSIYGFLPRHLRQATAGLVAVAALILQVWGVVEVHIDSGMEIQWLGMASSFKKKWLRYAEIVGWNVVG